MKQKEGVVMQDNQEGGGEMPINGHDFRSGNQLQSWIEHELAHLAVQDQEDSGEVSLPDRNLSLRIPVMTHLMLYRIAQKLGRSKTALGEEILIHAVRDVYRQFDLPRISTADLEEYASQTEKAIPEKAPRATTSGRR
ncbi:MAG: hypothetical protein JO250_14900 [Armatimonadetes bacterium]|nr:hypothetical protein [Armatimonadota bacterium]